MFEDTLLKEYKFKSVYNFLSIISDAIENKFDFWNFDGEQFVESALRFNKVSLLHIYVSSTLYCYYSRVFRKSGDLIEEDDIEWWINLMKEYGIKLKKPKSCDDYDFAWKWFNMNEEIFMQFFDTISDEIIHILFNDKLLLVKFNQIVRNVLLDEDGTYADIVEWPKDSRNEDGTIKRCHIPKWVKRAVFHRDKGHCVFCNRDLSGIISILHNNNFDHIVPLKDYGTNDPCNIQLACEDCNKKKGAKNIIAKYLYQSWW